MLLSPGRSPGPAQPPKAIPSKGLDGPTRSYNPIIRDRGHARPQNVSWHWLTSWQSGESFQRSTYALLAGVLLNLLV